MDDEVLRSEAIEQAVVELEARRYKILSALMHELMAANADPENANFARAFRLAQTALEMSPLEMSLLFKVSRPTVGRWARGVTAPHPLLRKAIYDTLIIELRDRLKGLNRPK